MVEGGRSRRSEIAGVHSLLRSFPRSNTDNVTNLMTTGPIRAGRGPRASIRTPFVRCSQRRKMSRPATGYRSSRIRSSMSGDRPRSGPRGWVVLEHLQLKEFLLSTIHHVCACRHREGPGFSSPVNAVPPAGRYTNVKWYRRWVRGRSAMLMAT